MKKIPTAVTLLSIGGIITSVYLVVSELTAPPFCPRVLGIPACYLVLLAFILVLVSVFIKNVLYKNILFFIGADLGFLLAVWFSVNQIQGLIECPKFIGLPLCYVSLIVFCLLLGLKVFKIKNNS